MPEDLLRPSLQPTAQSMEPTVTMNERAHLTHKQQLLLLVLPLYSDAVCTIQTEFFRSLFPRPLNRSIRAISFPAQHERGKLPSSSSSCSAL